MDGFERVSKTEPCAICGRTDWCCRLVKYHLCMCVESTRPHKKGGWLHPRDTHGLVSPPLPPRKPRIDDGVFRDKWENVAALAAENGASKLPELAAELGVTFLSLSALRVGFANLNGPCWTFPERNHRGWVIGISKRLASGRKLCATDSRRGLSYRDSWHQSPGAIWIVEGGSDTAAGISLGICVVGRPSNVGGIDYLIPLLRPHRKRKIIILGERDQKDPDDVQKKHPNHNPRCRCCVRCYPGKAGAQQVAKALRSALHRPVGWAMPPRGFKDLRSCVCALSQEDFGDYGRALQSGRFPPPSSHGS